MSPNNNESTDKGSWEMTPEQQKDRISGFLAKKLGSAGIELADV